MARKKNQDAKVKPDLFMVFGENENDSDAIRSLVKAIWQHGHELDPPITAELPDIRTFRAPLVLIRGRDAAQQKKNAASIGQVVRTMGVTRTVRAVFAHEDCDAVEPAHVQSATEIETRLAAEGIPNPAAVTPAWEMEAWWYLWPDEVAEVCASWEKLKRTGQNVGLIKDAKEALIKDLRPKTSKKNTFDYSESDSREIAANVLKNKKAYTLAAKSDSYIHFRTRVETIAKAMK
ncbi:hypothetical protein KTD22_12630 [Burkholderia multivorans]|uniref:hypothetical protein n=1 Tax=Burkholderia multivorans TaxID=87883 RepID=UPI001C22D363|nr:hypothetical protein [Burkholderia multivorans]MBU9227471.1 hypothetical protein [Burkholderia multivorans]